MSKKHKHKQGRQPVVAQQQTAAPRPTATVATQRSAVAPAAPSQTITLTPLAPLIIRSGRPFDDQTGSDPARLPPPSTLAGALRTAWAQQEGIDFGPDLYLRSVIGPLLQRGNDLLLPKPADALYFGHAETAQLVRAAPQAYADGCGSDLPEGLLPVQLTKPISGKPGSGPAWWHWEDWIGFRSGKTLKHKEISQRGWSPPPGDRRTHVAIDPATGGSKAGALFQTQGLDMAATLDSEGKCTSAAIAILAHFDQPIAAGAIPLGGERRLAAIAPATRTLPTPPAGWLEAIARAGGLSLTLITPAIFAAGFRPAWLDEQLTGSPPTAPGVKLRLRAVANERWQPHSGWDLANHKHRATRKVIPAGAVYWCEILPDSDTSQLANLWLGSLCDGDQDRRDGFGLALPAAWQPVQQ
jgi:CRISPR-associated protein Cmr3